MKRLFLFSTLLLLVACGKQSKTEKAIEEVPLDNIRVERFDKAFFETPPAGLPALKRQYPEFFPASTPDSVWIAKMTHPQWRELYNEVQKRFPDFNKQTAEIEDLFRHIKYYYPKTPTPTVVTLINEMDYNTKVLYRDGLVLISLELYLGKDHKFYDYPEYLRQNFEPGQMMPDIAAAFAATKLPELTENTLLAQMVRAGKELYMKDLLLPNYSDAAKIGYTDAQIAFCKENEGVIWTSFVEQKLLYSTDGRLGNRFINPAPFSKFYLEVDNETPGRIGTWVGWQIVRAYMEQNEEVSLTQLLAMDANEIFTGSHYKPKLSND
ncbi:MULTISPECIES: gliding motility lipoprotein GldB [unclassified Flavobacterium]|uniref:gliding motility lipoprotein GldB n=1 Tax=unclassified Flavobacterium TaxID=196869 RepID=UPI001F12AEE0|nr:MULTISPECIES: gliding motility lipoprotein GldB [unclassified Flavobacterium]UMY66799.1 gliding motility lipoprotein GldB [Flavobacterium sp. HJ-32-4]